VEYVVLDTDVASQIIRERLTGPLLGRLAGPVWAVTFVTVGELWKWAELRSWGPRSRSRLETWLGRVVVLPYNAKVSRTWGQIAAAGQRRGRTLPVNDSWIAACCLARELPLATLNVKDYIDMVEHEGLMLLTN
jgi:predicted nucleic acid-binding protein